MEDWTYRDMYVCVSGSLWPAEHIGNDLVVEPGRRAELNCLQVHAPGQKEF